MTRHQSHRGDIEASSFNKNSFFKSKKTNKDDKRDNEAPTFQDQDRGAMTFCLIFSTCLLVPRLISITRIVLTIIIRIDFPTAKSLLFSKSPTEASQIPRNHIQRITQSKTFRIKTKAKPRPNPMLM